MTPEASTETEIATQLSEVLAQLQSLTERVASLEAKLKLVSDVDRYGKLQQLLAAGNFRAADNETIQIILETITKTRETMTPDDIAKFPCNVLQVIDRLWRDYSGDRFGFSVQTSIYLEQEGNLDTLRAQNVEIIQKFGDRVGWRQDGEWQSDSYDSWDFSPSAPKGCFPAAWWESPYGLKMATFCFIRLLECQIS